MAETVGWLADKLSIVELKIYHMQEQAERTDAAAEFIARCNDRLVILRLQRDDLAAELTALLSDIAAGRMVPKVYRQYKMYNDPAYKERKREAEERTREAGSGKAEAGSADR